ncbi:hypothetical protein GCM10009111_06790 [Colwellia asteriadis]|uniref:Uncharacterized protein n=1 Tax=Colwellia asteriadis TaxID=517723 RepID=A0ABN1L4A7_9GAMM
MLRLSPLILLLFAINAFAIPKITVKHQRTAKGFAQVQVVNKTLEKLICHVAINGHKKKFTLVAHEASTWYTATDKRFNHRHFSIWCNLDSLHNP